MTEPIYISPSELGSWLLCPGRVLRQGHPGYDGRSNEPPAWGTGLHAGIQHKLQGGVIEGSNHMLDLWYTSMKEHPKHPEDIFEYMSVDGLKFKAGEMVVALELFDREVVPHLPMTLSVEVEVERFLGSVAGRDVYVRGTADYIGLDMDTDTLSMIDWKSSGSGWKPKKASAEVQRLLYPWAAGEDWGDVRTFTYVVYDRKNQRWDMSNRFEVTRVETEAVLTMAMAMAEGLAYDVGTDAPMSRGGFGDGRAWYCRPAYCGAWNICPSRHLIPDGVGEQVRPEAMQW